MKPKVVKLARSVRGIIYPNTAQWVVIYEQTVGDSTTNKVIHSYDWRSAFDIAYAIAKGYYPDYGYVYATIEFYARWKPVKNHGKR
jgi:hypothetical protein